LCCRKTDRDKWVRIDGTPLDRGRQVFGGHGHGLDFVQPLQKPKGSG